jgi:hypothetical protein
MGNFPSRIIRNPEHCNKTDYCGSPSTVDNVDNVTHTSTPLTRKRNDLPAVVDTVNISSETVAYPETARSSTPPTPRLNIETDEVPEKAYKDIISFVTVANPETACEGRTTDDSKQGSSRTSPTTTLNIETDEVPKVTYNDKDCEGGTTDDSKQGSSYNRWYWLLAEDDSHVTIHNTTKQASVRKQKRPRGAAASSDAEAEHELSASRPRRRKDNYFALRPQTRKRKKPNITESCEAEDEKELSASRSRCWKKSTGERRIKMMTRKISKGIESCEEKPA